MPSSAINSGCRTLTPVSIITASTPFPVNENKISSSTVSVAIPTALYGVDLCPPLTKVCAQFDRIEFVCLTLGEFTCPVINGLL